MSHFKSLGPKRKKVKLHLAFSGKNGHSTGTTGYLLARTENSAGGWAWVFLL